MWQGAVLGALDSLLTPIKVRPLDVALPRPQPAQPETPLAEVDAKIKALHAASSAWCQLGSADRAKLLRQCLDCAIKVRAREAALCCC